MIVAVIVPFELGFFDAPRADACVRALPRVRAGRLSQLPTPGLLGGAILTVVGAATLVRISRRLGAARA